MFPSRMGSVSLGHEDAPVFVSQPFRDGGEIEALFDEPGGPRVTQAVETEKANLGAKASEPKRVPGIVAAPLPRRKKQRGDLRFSRKLLQEAVKGEEEVNDVGRSNLPCHTFRIPFFRSMSLQVVRPDDGGLHGAQERASGDSEVVFQGTQVAGRIPSRSQASAWRKTASRKVGTSFFLIRVPEARRPRGTLSISCLATRRSLVLRERQTCLPCAPQTARRTHGRRGKRSSAGPTVLWMRGESFSCKAISSNRPAKNDPDFPQSDCLHNGQVAEPG